MNQNMMPKESDEIIKSEDMMSMMKSLGMLFSLIQCEWNVKTIASQEPFSYTMIFKPVINTNETLSSTKAP